MQLPDAAGEGDVPSLSGSDLLPVIMCSAVNEWNYCDKAVAVAFAIQAPVRSRFDISSAPYILKPGRKLFAAEKSPPAEKGFPMRAKSVFSLLIVSAAAITFTLNDAAGFPEPPGLPSPRHLPGPPGVPVPPGVPGPPDVIVPGYLPAPPGVYVRTYRGRPYYVDGGRRVYLKKDRRHHGDHGKRHGHDK